MAITGGVIAANTNPWTGIPVDLALVGHGGYGMATNAPAAFKGDPNAAEKFLLSGSEAVGGMAGAGGQVRAIFGPASAPTTSEAAGRAPEQGANINTPATDAAVQGGAGPEAETNVAPGAPQGRIARTLGITDPPPNQLLTKEIKPLASNTGWDRALATGASDRKALEAEGCTKGYECEDQDDGSVQISIPVGIRRMLLGYDIDEVNQVIFLNYLKWDGLREKLDWLAGLLGNDPGRKQ
jgi:hypothetical protein